MEDINMRDWGSQISKGNTYMWKKSGLEEDQKRGVGCVIESDIRWMGVSECDAGYRVKWKFRTNRCRVANLK